MGCSFTIRTKIWHQAGVLHLEDPAARYADHLDYSQDWITEERFDVPRGREGDRIPDPITSDDTAPLVRETARSRSQPLHEGARQCR